MFHEIQRIAQDYNKVHPTKRIEKTKFAQIPKEMKKIEIACNHGEPYHHKIHEYNDLNYGKSSGSTSNKILIRHERILKV